MSIHNIPFLIYKQDNCPKLSQICSYGIFPRDPRTSSKQPWQTSHQCLSHLRSTVFSRFSCSKVQIPPHYSRPKPIIFFLTICSSFSHKFSKFESLNKLRSDLGGKLLHIVEQFLDESLPRIKIAVVVLLFYVHGKNLRSCRDGQLLTTYESGALQTALRGPALNKEGVCTLYCMKIDWVLRKM